MAESGSTESEDAARRQRWTVNLSISAAAVALYLLGLEVYLWARGDTAAEAAPRPGSLDDRYANIFRRSSDPILAEELIPGANGVVNADGYMGPLYPRGRAVGAYRILGLGDSITMYHSAERENYLYRTEQALLATDGVPPVQVLNFGVASYDTVREVHQLEVRGLAYEPDLVVVGYCLNDGIDFRFTVNELTGRVLFDASSYSPSELFGYIETALRSAGEIGTPDTFFERASATETWRAQLAAFDRLHDLSAEHGFDVVVLIFPILVDFSSYPFERIHAAVAAHAAGLGFDVVDLLATYRAAATATALQDDVIHPNARGHALAAEALTTHLRARGLRLREVSP